MKDIRRFDNNTLFAIKAFDRNVSAGTKVAVLGRFVRSGTVRPGFKVNFMSTEGVAGTSQVIRFANRHAAENWLQQKHSEYDYAVNDLSIMNNRAGEYIRLPLCDFAEDVWVKSTILNRFSNPTLVLIDAYCPEYLDDTTPNPDRGASNSYRGFRF